MKNKEKKYLRSASMVSTFLIAIRAGSTLEDVAKAITPDVERYIEENQSSAWLISLFGENCKDVETVAMGIAGKLSNDARRGMMLGEWFVCADMFSDEEDDGFGAFMYYYFNPFDKKVIKYQQSYY